MSEYANLYSSMTIHPGEMLRDEIVSRGITQKELASAMGVSYTVLNEVLNGHRPVTTEYALLLEAVLDTPAYIWLRLQEEYNLRTMRENPSFISRLSAIRRIAALW